ncbi:MAG: ketosteroid isomerase-like protein [Planctomycetota bacterium]|jgi:ketosteroid isomerase-like protein
MDQSHADNTQLIESLYEHFAAGRGEQMAALYHPDARFRDPVFQELLGPRAGHMWRMLTGRAKGLVITASGIQADAASGQAHWAARYTFSTGRPVHNRIDARFRFEDGLIIEHVDSFSLWLWSRMALGLPGTLLGWSPLMRRKIQRQAMQGLERWEAKYA